MTTEQQCGRLVTDGKNMMQLVRYITEHSSYLYLYSYRVVTILLGLLLGRIVTIVTIELIPSSTHTVRYGTVRYGTVRYDMVRYGTGIL